jgi:2-alkyl-3-oxoalkanoate reductase
VRVLLTGATGFVGGRVAARLRERGDEVVALVRQPSDALATLGVEQLTGGFDAIDEALGGQVAAIVHAAATAGPDLAAARAVNRDATARLVDAALATSRPRFVHVSTTSVYDLEAIGDAEVREDAPLVQAHAAGRDGTGPSPYAVTKVEAEAEVVRGASAGLTPIILRPPAILGAGASSTWGTRVPERIRDGQPLPMHLAATFGWVHVEDLVDAVVRGVDRDVVTTANVVGGHTAAAVYYDEVRSLFPDAPPLVPGERAWRGRYASDRLPDALGFTPSRSYEDAMEEIRRWWERGDRAGTQGDHH